MNYCEYFSWDIKSLSIFVFLHVNILCTSMCGFCVCNYTFLNNVNFQKNYKHLFVGTQMLIVFKGREKEVFFFNIESNEVNGVLFICEGLFITLSITSLIVCAKYNCKVYSRISEF